MDSFSLGHLPLGEGRVYQADCLTRADQIISDGLVEVYIPGRGKTVFRLGIKSWFAAMALNTRDSTWGLLFLFLTLVWHDLLTLTFFSATRCPSPPSLPHDQMFLH